MMTGEALLEVLDELDRTEDGRVEELDEYVRTSSVSCEPRGVLEASEFLHGHAAAWGLAATTLPNGDHPAIVLRGPTRPDVPTVLVYGHYDVQPSGAREQWRFEPFQVTLHDGRLYGRGTADNKGQHLAWIHALAAWIRVAGSVPVNVVILLDGEEEVGSPNLAELIARHRDELRCDLVLWSDGPVHESGRATLNFGVRGIVSFELIARGAEIDLHSGNWGGVAPQPAWTLVHLLATMRDRGGRLRIDQLESGAHPLSDTERRALEVLPIDREQLDSLGIRVLDVPLNRGYYERLAEHATLTINTLDTGSSGGDRSAIPARARAHCDVRLIDGMTAEHTFACIVDHVRRMAPEVEVNLTSAMDPSRTSLDLPWVPAIRRAVTSIQGREPLLVPAMGGSLPDYVFTKVLGVPSIGVPFANADEANHGPNENIELWRYLQAPKIAAALLAELAEVVA